MISKKVRAKFFNGSHDIKNGIIVAKDYCFLVLKEMRDYDVSEFAKLTAFGAYRGVHERFLNTRLKNSDDFLDQLSYDVSIDLLAVGSLKTIIPYLEVGGYESLFNVLIVAKTPNNEIFPFIFYFGPSGTAIASNDSESQILQILKEMFITIPMDVTTYNPFTFSKRELTNFLKAFASALRKVSATDFQAVYEHDFGKERMGIEKGIPFIRRYYPKTDMIKKTEKLINKSSQENIPFNHMYYVTTSPDGKYVMSGFWDGYLSVWDYNSKKLIYSIKAHSQLVGKIIVLDNELLISSSFDGQVRFWDFKSGELIQTLKSSLGGIVRTMFFSERDQCLISCLFAVKKGKEINRIEFYDVEKRKLLKTLNFKSVNFTPFVITPDEKFLIGTNDSFEICIFDIDSERFKSRLRGHSDYIKSLYLTPDGYTLISGSEDYSTKVWNLRTGKLESTLKGEASHSCVFPDCNYLVRSIYTTIYIEDLKTYQRVTSFKAHETFVWSLHLHPSHKVILFCAGTDIKMIDSHALKVQNLFSRKDF